MGAGGGLTMGLAQSVLAAEGVRAGRGGGWAFLALAGPAVNASSGAGELLCSSLKTNDSDGLQSDAGDLRAAQVGLGRGSAGP